MSNKEFNCPNAFSLWVEKTGDETTGHLEWYCPVGGCEDYSNRHCCYSIINAGRVVCTNPAKHTLALLEYGIPLFARFCRKYIDEATGDERCNNNNTAVPAND